MTNETNSNIALPDFTKANVLVVGDLMLDRYWQGDTSRISPEAPIPVVKVGNSEDRIGGAGNVALNIASLGAKASLLALVGDDEAARILEDKLHAAEVSCSLIRHPSRPTTLKLRVMSRHQQMIRLDFEEDLAEETMLSQLGERFQALLVEEDFDAIVFSDYAKGCLKQVGQLIELARQHNVPTLVDPKSRDFSIYHGATVITPNRQEFEATTAKVLASEDALQESAMTLLGAHELQALLLTRSEEGMSLYQHSNGKAECFHFAAHASEVFDVTGAGDTVIATLATALSAGASLPDAVAIANRAAGIVVGKSGTAAIALHELEAEMHSAQANSGIVTASQLASLVRAAQGRGQKVVMTNGCFDIIHAGHIAYLEEASQLGDKLIVAVNSDDSVKRLKGEARPINTLERRMQVLAGLQSVDWVVSFSEDTPAALVGQILPDILVKGGDWNVEEIAGGEAVVAKGGKVMSLSFKEGHSTTAIIDLIREREQMS